MIRIGEEWDMKAEPDAREISDSLNFRYRTGHAGAAIPDGGSSPAPDAGGVVKAEPEQS